MTDLVQRLRDGLESGAVDMADIMDAADEIVRLRMTDAEREAVRYMIAAGKFGQRDEELTEGHASTLRGLLARLA